MTTGPEPQTASAVLMVRPLHFGWNEQTAASNTFQHPPREPPLQVRQQALAEFAALHALLERSGVRVIVFEDLPTPHTPDALFPNKTVAENLAFPLQVRKLPREDVAKRIDRALEMVKLPQFRNRRPGQLSGGQQQRVALARALVFDPALVLMDEPLGALDKQLREHMQLEIKHLHQQLGITIVYVTHDQSEALTMSDRVAVFNDGEIRQLATPNELYERPENSFVAQFIGENNRLRGVIEGFDGGDCVVRVGGEARIRARAMAAARVGEETTLSLRPERIRIGSAAGHNAFDARVEELIYLGDHTRLRLSLLGRSDFMVKVPIAEGADALAPGATIRVAWRPEDCRALDPM